MRELGDAADTVGRPVEGLVVDDRELPVGREVHVQLDRVGTGLDPEPERFHRVLGRLRRRAPVRHHQRHRATSPGGTMAGSSGVANASSTGGRRGGSDTSRSDPAARSA